MAVGHDGSDAERDSEADRSFPECIAELSIATGRQLHEWDWEEVTLPQIEMMYRTLQRTKAEGLCDLAHSIGFAARSAVDAELWKQLNEHIRTLAERARGDVEEEGVEESLFYAMAGTLPGG